MRTRSLVSTSLVGLLALALLVPAEASAKSFPSKVGDYVSNHTGWFVAALCAAILLLLLVVSVTQRRAKEKAEKEAAAGAGGCMTRLT